MNDLSWARARQAILRVALPFVMSRDMYASLPNLLSLSRLGAAVAFPLMTDPRERFGLVLFAALTDYLDGWFARRAHVATRWGALLDPITDRIFVFTAVCVFLVERQVTTLQYFVLLFRDVMTAIGFLVAKSVSWLRPITFRARFAGKLVTALQLAALVSILLRPEYLRPLIAAIAGTALWAVVDYTLLLWRERVRDPAGPSQP